jgi:hypothetical protein
MKKIYEAHLNNFTKPEVTYMCPIYNMDFALPAVFKGITSSYSVSAEVFFILDACSDKSEPTLLKLIENFISTGADQPQISFYVFRSRRNLFESKAENFVLSSMSSAKYVISIQADIILEDYAYDKRIIQIFEEFDDIFMISGRGTHQWELPESLPKFKDLFFTIVRGFSLSFASDTKEELSIISSKKVKLTSESLLNENYFGRSGRNHALEVGGDPILLYLSDTVMRGPLAFRISAVKSFGGLDWKRHRLGNDDHELALRGWRKLSLRTAYYPAVFKSPINWGATRRRKTLLEALIYGVMRCSERFYHLRKCSLDSGAIDCRKPQKEIRRLGEAK